MAVTGKPSKAQPCCLRHRQGSKHSVLLLGLSTSHLDPVNARHQRALLDPNALFLHQPPSARKLCPSYLESPNLDKSKLNVEVDSLTAGQVG